MNSQLACASTGSGATTLTFVVKCFADKAHAELFMARFGGEYLTPRRGRDKIVGL